MLYPMKFAPIFKQRIWGGRRLAELFDKPLPAGHRIGESWELSGLAGDESAVANGPLAGTPLGELVDRFGGDLLGQAGLLDGQFPLLVKLLDAREPLSVQVHPDAAAAGRLGSAAQPKSEAWYVVDAQPGAKLWIGLNAGVGREQFARAIRAGTVGKLLHEEPAEAGRCFYLPAGTVHALGGGLVVAEVQTPSDTTYRVFDWNRVDPQTGRSRPLHVAEALESIHFGGRASGIGGRDNEASAAARSLSHPDQSEIRNPKSEMDSFSARRPPASDPRGPLVQCEHFVVRKAELRQGVERQIAVGELAVWLALSGRGEIRGRGRKPVGFKAGELVLLPAAMAAARVVGHDDCAWLEVTVPGKKVIS